MSVPFLVGLIFFSQAFAEVLAPIEVQGDKDVEFFTSSDSSSTSRRTIETSTSALTSKILEDESSLVPSENGGPGSRVSYFIRGTEARHLSFTLDGMKINDASNIDRQFDAGTLTSGFLQGITLHKGPQAVLFGSDAMGGLIEMKTRRGSDRPESKFTLNAGSFGTTQGLLSSDWGLKKSRGTITLSQFHTDGISRLNKKRHNATERDATDITQVSSSSEHEWASRFKTELLFVFNHSRSQLDGYNDDNSFDETNNDQYITQQKTYFKLGNNQTLSLRNGFNRHQRKINTLALGKEFYNGNLIQHEIIHRVDWNKFSLLSGTSAEHEGVYSNNISKSFDLFSLYTQGVMKLGGFVFHAGGRGEEHSRYGRFLTGAGGITYKRNVHKAFLQYSQGFKAPSLYQLYEPASSFGGIGNSDLIPEKNHSLQLGWEMETEGQLLGVTLFQNRLSDLITFTSAGYINEDQLTTEGVELKAKYKFKKFELYGNYTHQQFKDFETPVLRRPYNIAMLGARYLALESLEIYAKGQFFSSREDTLRLDGYETIDFGVKKTWEKDELGIEMKNILNREYETIYGFGVLPRSVFAHYGHTF